MPYRFSPKFDDAQKRTAAATFRAGIKTGLTSTAIINSLQDEGLGYRRTNMLRDIRRARAIETSKTVDSGSRAVTWYDQVFESFIEANNLTPQQGSTLWQKTITESFDTLTQVELDLAKDWLDRYEQAFK